jgi:hypothetical protein
MALLPKGSARLIKAALRVFILLLLASIGPNAPAGANAFGQRAEPPPKLERVEWTWAESPVKYDPALPNILLIGDSISRNYYPDVAANLSGVANCFLFATSATVGDPRLEKQLADYFSEIKVSFSVMHINNGMHGWKYSEEEYSNALPNFLAAVRAGSPDAALIWALTTPVLKGDSGATVARVEERNASVTKLAKSSGILIDDQHHLMLPHDELHSDPVHYGAAGSHLQAEQASDIIAALLKRKK